MRQWLDTMERVVLGGVRRPDRTGVGTWALFGMQISFDLQQGFPAVTTKKLHTGPMWGELAAFIQGCSHLDDFHRFGCHIWDDNGNADYWTPKATEAGSLGRIYGVQWRDWLSCGPDTGKESTDQLRLLVDGIKRDPYGRRHLVTAWNPGELDQMCLPPCHVLFQCFVRPAALGKVCLDMRVDMRSVDLFLGLPFDVASFATLQHLVAKDTGLMPGKLYFQLGDAHVYCNHLEQVMEVLRREPLPLPRLKLDPATSLFNFHPDHAQLVGYQHRGVVSAPMNV
jgi:thymidylate synthase